jgi:hypothetical protein
MSANISTSLDLSLDVEQEAKFNALKTLQMKKIKQLMISIDTKDKEIAKLKILGKANRQAEMIQALKKKIRDQEMINDVIKEELAKPRELGLTLEEVNEIIMRKTLGGPKRFRPLTREELENKIVDLEKKLEKSTNRKNVPAALSGASSQENKQESKSTPQISKPSIRASGTDVGSEDSTKLAPLVEEIQRLKMAINAKDGLLDLQREDVVRLRARNAELVSVEEEVDYLERQNVDLKGYNEKIEGFLEDATRKLAEALEGSLRVRSDVAVVNENQQAEVAALHKQCDKLLKQNSQFLQRISELELEVENLDKSKSQSMVRSSSVEAGLHNKDATIRLLEDKLNRSTDKLKQFEGKCSALEMEVSKIGILMDQLREKNIEISALKKKVDDRDDKIAAFKAKLGVSMSTDSLHAIDNIADGKKSSGRRADGSSK